MRQDKPLDVSACLESPERAIGLLNRVISSGGDLDAIKQAVGVVTAALELDFNRAQPPETRNARIGLEGARSAKQNCAA